MTVLRDRASMSTGLDRIAELARAEKALQFTSIAHLLTVEALERAFSSLRKDASAGVYGVTYAEYGAQARANLETLHDRLKSGEYRAQPLRRVYIPKEAGTWRPLSIPTVTAYCGAVQYAFRVPHRDAPVPPVGGAAAADPFRTSSSDRSHLYL